MTETGGHAPGRSAERKKNGFDRQLWKLIMEASPAGK